jgi:K+-sensing histidine kinase KdpD
VCQWSRSQALATIASRLTLDSLKATYQDVLDAGADHEQLIEALLTLARSQQDLEDHETFDLAEISRDVIQTHQHHAAGQQVAIDTALSPAPISGDPRLARTLLTNLLENALGYNVPHGRVNITLRTRGHRTTLTINNIGPHVPAGQIDRLLQPFRRLTPDRSNNSDGHGLGLSIVAAIATAHNATLDVKPRPDGGLRITIEFPAAWTDHENAPNPSERRLGGKSRGMIDAGQIRTGPSGAPATTWRLSPKRRRSDLTAGPRQRSTFGTTESSVSGVGSCVTTALLGSGRDCNFNGVTPDE